MNPLEVLIPVSFFAVVALIVYFVSKYQYQTRKAIIDKGGNFELPKRAYRFLEIGGILVGVGIGLAISVLFQESNLSEDSRDMLTGASILLFGGIGLIVTTVIRKRVEENNK